MSSTPAKQPPPRRSFHDDDWFGPAPYDEPALRRRRRLMSWTLALAVALLAIKSTAFWITGSHALLSDALESVVNVVTGGFGLFSVWLAGRPPDRSHPYGHGRVEFFAAGVQGAMILGAAVLILREAVPRIVRPEALENTGRGLVLAAVAGLINGLVALVLLRRGRRVFSATLVGEARHLFTDTLTTAGVIAGLAVVHLTGVVVIDPIVACGVACWIVWSGVGLLREAAARLMDRSDPELLAGIAVALSTVRRPEWIEVHLLRAWRSGDFVHMDFHLMFPRYWEMERIHSSQHDLLGALVRALSRPGEVMIHPDPCTPSLCPNCEVSPCPVRAAPFERRLLWTAEKLTHGPAGVDEDSCQVVQAAASRHVTRAADRPASGS